MGRKGRRKEIEVDGIDNVDDVFFADE